MRSFAVRAMAVALTSLSLGGLASAELITYDVSGTMSYKPAGVSASTSATLSGSFTINVDNNTLQSADVLVTANSFGQAQGFNSQTVGFIDNNGNESLEDPSFKITSTLGGTTYTLYFGWVNPSDPATTPVNLDLASYESEKTGSTTIVEYANTDGASNQGSATGLLTPTPPTVPEPSSIVLAGSALAITGCAGWLRRRRAVA